MLPPRARPPPPRPALRLPLRILCNLERIRTTSAGKMMEEKENEEKGSSQVAKRESILRLGPTFIKIGQQCSTRAIFFHMNMWINYLSYRCFKQWLRWVSLFQLEI